MPFTFAHPAAAVPLRRPLGRLGVLSALVVGSLTPDLAYFLPLGVSGRDSHSAAGLVVFCLPVGLLTYLVFHGLLKRPLMDLLPAALVARLWTLRSARRALPEAPWTGVGVSLLAGAATHVIWDTFTHAPAAGMGLLRERLLVVSDYPVHVYTVLQHGSTVAGLLALLWWAWRWARTTPPSALAAPGPVPAPARAIVLAALLVTIGLAAGAAAAPLLDAGSSVARLQRLAGRAAVAGLTTLGMGLLAWSVIWHAGIRPAPRRA